jgi:hypothetical protein
LDLAIQQLAYVLVPKDNATQVTILANVDVPPTEKSWIVNMAVVRSPLDWCNSLLKAAANAEGKPLKTEANSTNETRAETARTLLHN